MYSCRRARRALGKLFEMNLSARALSKLRSHLDACERCRALYDTSVRTLRVAQSADADGSVAIPLEHEVWLPLVLSERSTGQRSDARSGWGRSWALGGAGAVAAAAMIMLAVWWPPEKSREEWTARSGQGDFGMRAFCLQDSQDGKVAWGEVEAGRCRSKGPLRFGVRSKARGFVTAYLKTERGWSRLDLVNHPIGAAAELVPLPLEVNDLSADLVFVFSAEGIDLPAVCDQSCFADQNLVVVRLPATEESQP